MRLKGGLHFLCWGGGVPAGSLGEKKTKNTKERTNKNNPKRPETEQRKVPTQTLHLFVNFTNDVSTRGGREKPAGHQEKKR